MKTNNHWQQRGLHSLCMVMIQFMLVDAAWHATTWVGFYSQPWHVAIGTQVGKVVRKKVGMYICEEIKSIQNHISNVLMMRRNLKKIKN